MSKATPITDALAFEHKAPKVHVDWFELGGVLYEQKRRNIRQVLMGFAVAADEDNADLAETLTSLVDDHFPEGS